MNAPTPIMYGTPWCGDCRRSRRLLDQRQVAYQYIDIETDDAARQRVIEINQGNQSVPTIIFPDGSVLVEPSNAVLGAHLDALGL
ncbi:MAG: glutathione S-transferase N-terminal domain-containing protein [Chloroflexi bacterium]|nr:glutathione S-transferase N-terminal domain-containing protein [Chloroflexota bacterium]